MRASPTERLASFLRRELGPQPGRARAFGRALVAVLLSILVVQIFRPTNGYWATTFVLLVSSPMVGNSERDALQRVLATLLGGTAAVLLIIGAYDMPWIYIPLQALGIGATLFIARATPVGLVALTGGLTFAVITAGSREIGAAGLIGLALNRFLQSVAGGGLGALAQLALWREDPLAVLRRSLADQLARAETFISGRPTSLDARRVSRHFELLNNAEVRHPELAHRRAEIALVILETALIADRALAHERLPDDQRASAAARVRDMCAALRRLHDRAPFEPLPPPPPPPRPMPWPDILSASVRPSLKASLKAAVSAFLTLVILDAMQLTASGGLLMCLLAGLQMSTGTDLTKPLTLFAGILAGMVLALIATRLAVPNVDDFGTFLLVGALALTPTVWAWTAGPRVRWAGFYGSIVVAVGLFESYRASSDLEPATRFFVSLGIGLLVVTLTDLAFWSVNRQGVAAQDLSLMMRAAAELGGDLDPRIVLSPNSEPRWTAYKYLLRLAALWGEIAPVPGTPEFEHDEEVLRLATETDRLVVARIEHARQALHR